MFASYGLSVLLALPILILAKPTPALLAAVIAGHVLLSLLLHRFSRALFLGVDYFLDPAGPPSDDGDDDGIPAGLPPTLPAPRALPSKWLRADNAAAVPPEPAESR